MYVLCTFPVVLMRELVSVIIFFFLNTICLFRQNYYQEQLFACHWHNSTGLTKVKAHKKIYRPYSSELFKTSKFNFRKMQNKYY